MKNCGDLSFIAKRHLVLLLTLAISLAFFVAPTVSSAASSSSTVEVLSYSELMSLPYADRIAYVEGVRQILIDLSKQKDGRFSDSSPASTSKLRSWLEGIERQFPEAKADEESTSIFCREDKACREAMTSCFETNQTVTWKASMNSYICDSKKAFPGSSSSALSIEKRAQLFKELQRGFRNPKVKSASGETSQVQRDLFNSKPVFGSPRAAAVRFGSAPIPLDKIAKSSVSGYVNAMAAADPKKYGCVSKHQTLGTGSEITRPCSEAVEIRIASDFEKVQSQSNLLDFGPAPIRLSPPAPAAAVAAPVPAPSSTDDESEDTPPTESAPAVVTEAASSPVSPGETAVVAPMADSASVIVSRKISKEDVQAMLDQKLNPNRICDSESKKLSTDTMLLVAVPGKDYRYCMTAEAARLYGMKKLSLVENDNGDRPMINETEVSKSPRAPRATAAGTRAPSAAAAANASKSKLTCGPKLETCGDTKTTRGKIFQGELSCVFAGMVSQLDSQNRKCNAVTEFKLDSTTYKCASGQTMCNPLLFGTVSSSKAICVGRGHDVTEQCSKLSSPRDAERFLNRNETGLQNKWDEFREGFAKVCKPDSVQARFHCNECNVMRTRLFELHARILADPCGSRTSGESAVDGRIRIRSAPTSK